MSSWGPWAACDGAHDGPAKRNELHVWLSYKPEGCRIEPGPLQGRRQVPGCYCEAHLKVFRFLVVALLSLALNAPVARAQSPDLPSLGEAGAEELPPAIERRLGEQIMLQVRRDPTYLADPESTEYLNHLGYQLVSVSAARTNDFSFFIVRDPVTSVEFATRAGEFRLDANDYLITTTGLRVQGFSDGSLSTRGDIRINAEGYSERLAAAHRQLTAAVDGLRQSGQIDYIPRGLLTRAWLRFLLDDQAGCEADLDEVQEIAERGPMPLYLADLYLTRARLLRDPAALATARDLIAAHGYHRRDEELADAEAIL